MHLMLLFVNEEVVEETENVRHHQANNDDRHHSDGEGSGELGEDKGDLRVVLEGRVIEFCDIGGNIKGVDLPKAGLEFGELRGRGARRLQAKREEDPLDAS